MRFDIITIFPNIFNSYFNESILRRAQEKKIVQIKIHNLRDFTKDKHKKVAFRQAQGNFEPRRKVDDKPYGGGAGMVLMAEPIIRAVQSIKSTPTPEGSGLRPKRRRNKKQKIILFSAKGKQFNQKMAYDLSHKFNNIILISGRYEGIDERVKKILKAEEISIGPYVLTDGDAAAMVVVSAIIRLIPGVINWESLEEESYFNFLIKKEKAAEEGKALEYPHYTRPEVFVLKGKKYSVPKVLLSGNHQKIEKWRRAKRGNRLNT